jgi:hypothetical protein
MRRTLLLTIGVALAHASYADPPIYDRDLAVAVARAYVEAYSRWHPVHIAGVFGWNQPQVIFIPESDPSGAKGYVAVFFPATEGSYTGFTCFRVDGFTPDHLSPESWGWSDNLNHALENF